MTDQKYKLVEMPERSVWNLFTGRDGRNFTDGWNACLDACAAAPEPVCRWTLAYGWNHMRQSGYFIPECYDDEVRVKLHGDDFCPHCGRKVEVVEDE